MSPMLALAVEVWTTNAGLHFDNIVISNSLEKAFEFADATHTKKLSIETETENKEKKDKMKKNREEKLSKGNMKDTLEAYLGIFIEWVQDNVIAFVVSVVVSIGTLAYLTQTIFYSKKTPSTPSAEEAKNDADKDDDKDDDKDNGNDDDDKDDGNDEDNK
jgi:cobalamin biosynthesis protein CobT